MSIVMRVKHPKAPLNDLDSFCVNCLMVAPTDAQLIWDDICTMDGVGRFFYQHWDKWDVEAKARHIEQAKAALAKKAG